MLRGDIALFVQSIEQQQCKACIQCLFNMVQQCFAFMFLLEAHLAQALVGKIIQHGILHSPLWLLRPLGGEQTQGQQEGKVACTLLAIARALQCKMFEQRGFARAGIAK